MTRKTARWILAVLSAACPTATACGSRTGLLVPPPEDAQGQADQALPDDGPGPEDATAEDVLAQPEVRPKRDALPPIDGTFDAPNPCPDAGSTLVYLLTQNNDLYSFYPPTLAFRRIGAISCPGGGTPFSMAVDRQGRAYSVFVGGSLYQLDTATAACAPTTYRPNQLGFSTFGMGYAANPDGGETLMVAEGTATVGKPSSRGLGAIDTSSMTLRFVAPFSPPIPGPELTGTADGRLFAFYTNAVGSGSHIDELDRTTGTIIAGSALQVGTPQDGYAFAFWGGVFWVFTFSNSPGPTTVTRFDPSTGTESTATTLPEGVVGAGVSTCAPQ